MPVATARAAWVQKALAQANRSGRNLRLAAGTAAGMAASLPCVLWPTTGEAARAGWLAAGLVMGIVAGGIWAARRRQTPAACPVCGHDWEIHEGDAVPLAARMPQWDRCPGCGLPMSDGALHRAAGAGAGLAAGNGAADTPERDGVLLEMIDAALADIRPMALQSFPPAASIERQLVWCRAYASGHLPGPTAGPLSMGLIAVREFDMHGDHPALAALIHDIQQSVEQGLRMRKP